jgi:hypothetical protein
MKGSCHCPVPGSVVWPPVIPDMELGLIAKHPHVDHGRAESFCPSFSVLVLSHWYLSRNKALGCAW